MERVFSNEIGSIYGPGHTWSWPYIKVFGKCKMWVYLHNQLFQTEHHFPKQCVNLTLTHILDNHWKCYEKTLRSKLAKHEHKICRHLITQEGFSYFLWRRAKQNKFLNCGQKIVCAPQKTRPINGSNIDKIMLYPNSSRLITYIHEYYGFTKY